MALRIQLLPSHEDPVKFPLRALMADFRFLIDLVGELPPPPNEYRYFNHQFIH